MKKLVQESLTSFEHKKGSLSSIGLGRRALIEKWLDEMGVIKYIINDDLTIDVKGAVLENPVVPLASKNLSEFPIYIQFNRIEGNFNCSYNHLTSLRGCPEYVSGFFTCADNKLESLEYCPKIVGGDICYYNNKSRFTLEDIQKVCEVNGRIWIDEDAYYYKGKLHK